VLQECPELYWALLGAMLSKEAFAHIIFRMLLSVRRFAWPTIITIFTIQTVCRNVQSFFAKMLFALLNDRAFMRTDGNSSGRLTTGKAYTTFHFSIQPLCRNVQNFVYL
jgi:hypothetical protein